MINKLIKKRTFGLKFFISLIFVLAGIYSILQLLEIRFPTEVDGNILLWITSIGCLIAGFLIMFKRKSI